MGLIPTVTPDGQIIALISVGLAIMSTLVRYVTTDRDLMKEQREKMKEYQRALKEATKAGDTKKAQKIQGEFMKLSMESMKKSFSFKSMIVTTIPFLLIFGWLRENYDTAGTVATLFGFELGWFGWYFICMMIASMILNKALGMT